MRPLLNICIIVMKFIYFFIKLLPTKNKITFISRQSNSPSIDFNLLIDYISEKYPDIEICCLCKKLQTNVDTGFIFKIRYMFHMLNQMYNISTSKCIILDSYCITVSVLNHKKSLKVFQLWHSMGTLKKFGYAILDKKEGRSSIIAYTLKMHRNYDFVLCSSTEYKNNLISGFKCRPESIVICPLPRYDLLINKEYRYKKREQIYKKEKRLKGKKNILYCPTFRNNDELTNKAIDKLVDCIDFNKYNLVLCPHPLTKSNYKNDKIINSLEFSTFEMLFIADYIISDYSCVIYDASLLGIAVYFYMYDQKNYSSDRGTFIDISKELPGTVFFDPKDIINKINNSDYDYENLSRFCNKFITPIDSSISKIVSIILENTNLICKDIDKKYEKE